MCIDTGDSDFNTVKKTGGHKQLQNHTHTQQPHYHVGLAYNTPYDGSATITMSTVGGGVGCYDLSWTRQAAGQPYNNIWTKMTTAVNDATGGGNAQNLQPYMAVYIWVRTE